MCNSCNQLRDLADFYANSKSKDGKQNICKDCVRDYQKHVKEEDQRIKEAKLKKGPLFYIPDIFLVGYGRTQSYQICCQKCEKPFFLIDAEKTPENLFCDNCKLDMSLIRTDQISEVYVIGHVIGWIAKIEGKTPNKNRSIQNYKKVYVRDGYSCRFCNYSIKNAQKFLPLHIDHIRPPGALQANKMENLFVSCHECQNLSSTMLFHTFFDKKQYITMKRKQI